MKADFFSLLALAGSLVLPSLHAESSKTSVFPADCWGVYSWGSARQVNRQTHPLIKGLKQTLTDESGRMVVPLLVNYDSNREEQYKWVLENLPAIGLKNGMFSHGYHISDTKTRLEKWRAFVSDVKSAGKEFFSRGEQDAEYRIYGWSTQNIPQGLYWSAIFATHCGLDMWNLPTEACAGSEHRDAINFFNKYAGHHEAASAPAAFCALRKGLDASDVAMYPEERTGSPRTGPPLARSSISAPACGRRSRRIRCYDTRYQSRKCNAPAVSPVARAAREL